MKATQSQELVTTLQELKTISDTIVPVGMESINANGATYVFDLFAHAVLNRSLSIISGFIAAIESENFLCAAPLVRMHLDNLLRYYASQLVDNSSDFAMKVLEGESIRSMKDINGKKMTDSHLVKEVSKKLPWVERVYEETCGYVHLSDKHIFNAVAAIKGKRTIRVHISGKDENVPDELRTEAVQIMIEVTKQLINLVYGWINYKKSTPVDLSNVNLCWICRFYFDLFWILLELIRWIIKRGNQLRLPLHQTTITTDRSNYIAQKLQLVIP